MSPGLAVHDVAQALSAPPGAWRCPKSVGMRSRRNLLGAAGDDNVNSHSNNIDNDDGNNNIN